MSTALAPWSPLTSILEAMERWPSSNGQNGLAVNSRFLPAADVVETDDALMVRMDVPGMTQDQIKIEVRDNTLNISGERREESEQNRSGYHLLERSYGRFARRLPLPSGVEPERISARMDNGVLEVTVPKPEQIKPRRIEIGVNGNQPKTIESAQQE